MMTTKMKLRRYKKLRRQGHTISGLYKAAKQEGHSDDVIIDMLVKALPCGNSRENHTRKEIVDFVKGIEICLTCGREFQIEPGGWDTNCPKCQERIDKMWTDLNARLEETGEELDEETSTFAGIMIVVTAALTAEK